MKDHEQHEKGRLRRTLEADLRDLRQLEGALEHLEVPKERPGRKVDEDLERFDASTRSIRMESTPELRAERPVPSGSVAARAHAFSSSFDPSCTACFSLSRVTLRKRVPRGPVSEDLWNSLKSLLQPYDERGAPPRRLLGRFLVRALRGKGGSSRIYLADDTKLQRQVALKIVPAPASELVRQALPLHLRLKHRCILELQDTLELADGTLLLVMPMLDGTTLRNIIFAGRYASGALLLALRRACEGLAHAHRHGIVHRDVKPGNIQIRPDGRAVILDWGMACEIGRKASSRKQIGTPLYMAPEQFTGGTITARTDVFALGTVLYEMLTGRHPAGPAEDLRQIMRRACEEMPPPPSVLMDGIPTALDDLVLRCLAKDPEDRPENATEVLEAIEDA